MFFQIFTKINIVLLLIFLVIPTAQADTVIRSGDRVSVDDDQNIDGDFYSFAGNLNISGQIFGDLLAISGSPTINGVVNEDALLIGGSVDVHGPVGDDLRVVGGEVVIAAPVSGDVFVVGGNVNILSTAVIKGDLIVYGGEVLVNGAVGGDVLGAVSNLRIDSTVMGDVDINVENLVLGDSAVIEGNLVYVSNETLVRSPDATVGGEVTRNDPVSPTADSFVGSGYLVFILILAFSVLVLYMIARRPISRLTGKVIDLNPKTFLIGLALLLLTPFVFMILLVSVLGSAIGLLLMFVYLLLLVSTFIMTPIVIGRLAEKIYKKSDRALTLTSIGIGLIITAILLLIPVLGSLTYLVFMIFVIGTIASQLFRFLKN